MNPQVWVASGMSEVFPTRDGLPRLQDRHRADKLIEDQTNISPKGGNLTG
jgi:hypothetical protein